MLPARIRFRNTETVANGFATGQVWDVITVAEICLRSPTPFDDLELCREHAQRRAVDPEWTVRAKRRHLVVSIEGRDSRFFVIENITATQFALLNTALEIFFSDGYDAHQPSGLLPPQPHISPPGYRQPTGVLALPCEMMRTLLHQRINIDLLRSLAVGVTSPMVLTDVWVGYLIDKRHRPLRPSDLAFFKLMLWCFPRSTWTKRQAALIEQQAAVDGGVRDLLAGQLVPEEKPYVDGRVAYFRMRCDTSFLLII